MAGVSAVSTSSTLGAGGSSGGITSPDAYHHDAGRCQLADVDRNLGVLDSLGDVVEQSGQPAESGFATTPWTA